ncbi:MAG: hypothetical protein HFJ85_01885 [Oscillospiraceae bacterium]|nr:hypothetical protein [Oscillospiraceae bacterium]
MFAVITGKEQAYQKGGLLRKGYGIKTIPYKGGSYRVVSLKRRRVNWKKLVSELGAASSQAILCGDIQLPNGCGITLPDPAEISYAFLKNAVEFLLKSTPVPIQKRSATVIDLRGVYHDLARAMAKHCALLKVVTLHRESYEHLSEQLREEFGAVMQITDVLDHPNDNLMIVSPKGFGADFSGALSVPVFTLEPDQFKGTETVSGFSGADLSSFGLSLPDGVDPLLLAAVLYGIEAHRELKNFVPEKCIWDNREITLQNILEERFSLDTED